MSRLLAVLGIASALAFGMAACGDDDDDDDDEEADEEAEEEADESEGEAFEVGVTLQEYAVLPVVESAPAGEIAFVVVNEGPDETHEFVIFRTDLEAGDLPTVEDGSVDEAGEGVELIDEIEDIAVGDTASVTANLEAGSYVLICNILEEEEGGELESHYQQGMRTGFTVE
jgi:hypothetical protein